MARVSLPLASSFLSAVPQLPGWLRALLPALLVAGCASSRPGLPTAPEATPTGVASRVLVPRDLDVNPPETVIKLRSPDGDTSEPPSALGLAGEQTTFELPEAIAFALQHNPRLRSARAAIERARGQEQVAFAPFLPQIDLFGQYGATSGTLAPGIPGPTGFLLANGVETRAYAQTEVALQWTLYDFGRTGGRYRQAVSGERITELQLARAGQTVEFDVTVAYTDVLLARASRRIQEDAVRRAEATLDDTAARRRGGVALKEDVLRAEVQLSESREALVVAREGEFNALARLNYTMGRNAGWPLEVIDLETQPLPPGALVDLLELAAVERPEISLAQQAVATAREGRQAARGEFLPRIFVRAVAGRADGQGIVTGWQEGAGLHVESPLYAGGRHQGDMRSADAEIEGAVADAQSILDAISLQVNLAYRGVVAARERIELARTAVVQAEENLRLVRVRYRNGNAIPTEIVDSEAALTRSQQRFFSANYSYLAALARLDYALGQHQGASLQDSPRERDVDDDNTAVPELRDDSVTGDIDSRIP
jgi:outer membrane protein TolC